MVNSKSELKIKQQTFDSDEEIDMAINSLLKS
jgi:hypothetical protein